MPRPVIHGPDHLPGHADPIPGLMLDTQGGSWEDRVRAAGTLTAWWRLGDAFTPGTGATTVANAAVDSAAFDGSSPRNLSYKQATTGGGATPDVSGAPALGGSDDGALQFATSSDAYLTSAASSTAPWDVTMWGTSGDQLRSLVCWIKTPASVGGFHPIVGRWNMNSSDAYNVGWVIDLNGSTLRFQFATSTGTVVTITGPSLATATWYHVAVTYDAAATTWRLYVNGALDTGLVDATNTPGEPFVHEFWVGRGVYDAGVGDITYFFYGGTVDEVALYKTQLSAAAIAKLAAGVTVADGYVWTTQGGTPDWEPPTVEVDAVRYQEILLGTNLTGTDNGDDTVTIDATAGSSLTSPLTTKGDLWGRSTVDARVPVGTNGQVLTADSTQALGLKWAAGGGFDPATATTWWFPLVDSDGTCVLDGDGNLIPTLIPL